MMADFVLALALIQEPEETPVPPPPAPPAAPPLVKPNDGPDGSGHGPRPQPAPLVVNRRADASGQVWEHTDAAWLETWIRQRNAMLIRPASAPKSYAPRIYRGNCSTGYCPR